LVVVLEEAPRFAEVVDVRIDVEPSPVRLAEVVEELGDGLELPRFLEQARRFVVLAELVGGVRLLEQGFGAGTRRGHGLFRCGFVLGRRRVARRFGGGFRSVAGLRRRGRFRGGRGARRLGPGRPGQCGDEQTAEQARGEGAFEHGGPHSVSGVASSVSVSFMTHSSSAVVRASEQSAAPAAQEAWAFHASPSSPKNAANWRASSVWYFGRPGAKQSSYAWVQSAGCPQVMQAPPGSESAQLADSHEAHLSTTRTSAGAETTYCPSGSPSPSMSVPGEMFVPSANCRVTNSWQRFAT